jgi:L-fuculose-phosphate aldolase
VIHTHSIYASAFAVAGMPVPCVLDEQVLTLGGEVQVAAYAASASEKLANNAAVALSDRAAVLLRHHGALGVGSDLEEAAIVCELLERVARITATSRQLGELRTLPDDVIAAQRRVYRMMKGFKD